MGRKLVKQGKDALTISLPRKWLDKFNLKQGDELEVSEEDNRIVFYTKEHIAKKKSTLDVSGFNYKTIYNLLNFSYIKGYDEIVVKFEKENELESVKYFIPNLIGFAIIKETKNECILKDMGNTTVEDIDEVIKRIFTLVNSYIDDAITDIKVGSTSNKDYIISRDKDINKLVSLALRSLNKKTVISKEHSQALFNVLIILEHLGDDIGRFWRVACEHKLKSNEEVEQSMQFAKESIDKIFQIYYRFNKKNIDELLIIRDNARKDWNKKRTNISHIRFSRHTLQICEECADMMQSIFMIRL
ncbi:MAG: AbrB/MazE/SpoVT family DNA-binding domain-containing protein [Candidatus Woesearchaeota archaeon]|jgi:phosphate uptake regulator